VRVRFFRVLYVDGLTSELIGDFPLDTLPHKGENISVIIPCGVFSRGGIYTLQLQYKFSTVAARPNTAITGLSEIEVSNDDLSPKCPLSVQSIPNRYIHLWYFF